MKKCKNLTKRIISCVLIVALLVPAATVFSNAGDVEFSCPNIEVHGFMASKIYADKNDPNSTVIWPPNVDSILEGAGNFAPTFAELLLQNKWDELADEVSLFIYKSLFAVYLGEDGEVHDNSGAYFKYPAPETIKKDSEVQFTYDWRTDPVEIAAKLNDYVNYVLECSGSDKVTIECHSLGGAIVTSYLAIYGCDKVKGVCFNSTATFGSSFIGDMMSGDVNMTRDSVKEYLYFAFDYNDYNHLINGLINLADKMGILNFVANSFDFLLDEIGKQVAKKSVVPMFGNWLTIWSMVPNDEFDKVYNAVFNDLYAGEDHSALIAKIENYNNLVRYKKTDVIRELNEKANVYVISRYGYSSVPMIESYSSISDGIIDAKYSSFGATTSMYGQALEDSYLENIPPKYISPNKSIDASTCMFPEQTWFVYSMRHFKSPKPLAEFIDMLLAYNGQADVNTFEDYPRFLCYDAEDDVIKEDINTSNMTLWRKILIVTKEIFRLLKQWFTKKESNYDSYNFG